MVTVKPTQHRAPVKSAYRYLSKFWISRKRVKKSFLFKHERSTYCKPGTEFAKKLWGEQTLFLRCDDVTMSSTTVVVQPLWKIGKMGGTLWN